MDFSSVSNSSDLMNYYASMATDNSSSKLDAAAKADYSKASDEEMLDACKQFEEYFLEQIYKEMRKTVQYDDDSIENSSSMQYYQEMLGKEYASMATEQGGIGLAKMMYEQMKQTSKTSE